MVTCLHMLIILLFFQNYPIEYYLFFTSFLESGGKIWIVALVVILWLTVKKM